MTDSNVWGDRIAYARQMEAQTLAAADRVGKEPISPSDPYAADLRAQRYRAVIAEADAWADYRERAEEAYFSAVDAEIAVPAVVQALLPHYKAAS